MKTFKMVWRGLVVISRDMFIGFIIGVSAASVMYKINPAIINFTALLIPAGTLAGIFKGLTKFIFLNLSSMLPSKGYRFNYPKFKLLSLWIVVLLISLVYSFGFKLDLWFTVPLELLSKNTLLNIPEKWIWSVLGSFVTIAGAVSHIYEPPYNENEFLEIEPPEENESIE